MASDSTATSGLSSQTCKVTSGWSEQLAGKRVQCPGARLYRLSVYAILKQEWIWLIMIYNKPVFWPFMSDIQHIHEDKSAKKFKVNFSLKLAVVAKWNAFFYGMRRGPPAVPGPPRVPVRPRKTERNKNCVLKTCFAINSARTADTNMCKRKGQEK